MTRTRSVTEAEAIEPNTATHDAKTRSVTLLVSSVRFSLEFSRGEGARRGRIFECGPRQSSGCVSITRVVSRDRAAERRKTPRDPRNSSLTLSLSREREGRTYVTLLTSRDDDDPE